MADIESMMRAIVDRNRSLRLAQVQRQSLLLPAIAAGDADAIARVLDEYTELAGRDGAALQPDGEATTVAGADRSAEHRAGGEQSTPGSAEGVGVGVAAPVGSTTDSDG